MTPGLTSLPKVEPVELTKATSAGVRRSSLSNAPLPHYHPFLFPWSFLVADDHGWPQSTSVDECSLKLALPFHAMFVRHYLFKFKYQLKKLIFNVCEIIKSKLLTQAIRNCLPSHQILFDKQFNSNGASVLICKEKAE